MDHRRHRSVPSGFSFLADGPSFAAHADSGGDGSSDDDEEGVWTEPGAGGASGGRAASGALAKAWRNHPALLVALPVLSGVFLSAASTFETSMGNTGWFTLWVVVMLVLLLGSGVSQEPAMLFLGALTLLILGGVIDAKVGLGGFGDKLVVSIGLLYMVSAGIRESTLLSYVVMCLGRPKSTRSALARLLPAVACASAFMNNTPIVSMLIPVVEHWARECRLHAAQLLMPLSFATILGGMCTQIGTSVNLIVNAAAEGQGRETFTFLEVGHVGLPVAVVGVTYMVLCAELLLPQRGTVVAQLATDRARTTTSASASAGGTGGDEGGEGGDEGGGGSSSFATNMRVEEGSRFVGASAADTGLLELHPAVKLTSVARRGAPVGASSGGGGVGNDAVLEAGDVLCFAGPLSALTSVVFRTAGLAQADTRHAQKLKSATGIKYAETQLVVALVSADSSLVGQSLRSSRFRARYGAVLVGIRRRGYELCGQSMIRVGQRQRQQRPQLQQNTYKEGVPVSRSSTAPAGLAGVTFLPTSSPAADRLPLLRERRGQQQHQQQQQQQGQQPGEPFRFQHGDTLLLETSKGFVTRQSANSRDFDLVSLAQGDSRSVVPRVRPRHAAVGGLAILVIAGATAAKLLDLPTSCLVATFLLLGSGTVSAAKAKAAVSGSTLTIIACGFGVAKALVTSGAATAIASCLKVATRGSGDLVPLSVIFGITALVSNVISPPACASLMFPVAFELPYADLPSGAADINEHVDKTLGILMIASSCSFLSPFAYQTNLMVTEAAGYSVREFLRFGGPLVLLSLLVSVTLAGACHFWGVGDPFGGDDVRRL
jgi:di/tricarboxylate transporter